MPILVYLLPVVFTTVVSLAVARSRSAVLLLRIWVSVALLGAASTTAIEIVRRPGRDDLAVALHVFSLLGLALGFVIVSGLLPIFLPNLAPPRHQAD